MKEKIDRAEKTLLMVNDWIKVADQKINTLLALEGLLLTIIIPNYLNAFFDHEKAGTVSNVKVFFVLIGLGLMIFSLYKASMGIISRLNKGIYPKSPLFFGEIQTYSLQQYKDVMNNMTESEYHERILEQVHVNSKIATQKHTYFRDSVIYLLVSYFLGIACFIWIKLF